MIEHESSIEVVVDDCAHPEVTLRDLRAILDEYGRVNPTVDAHLLSVFTTGRIMGPKWCSKWGWEFSRKNRVGMYFRPSDAPDDQHVTWRQIRFAELLFNLQRLKGFRARRDEWRGNEPEAIVAELESAFYMKSCGHRPSFAPTDAEGRRTPDFDVTLRFGLKCAWEAKARMETSPFREEQLINALGRARKQLPKDVNNIIFVRIPEHWSLEPDFESRIQNPIDHLFRNSERAISVLLHWELWETPHRGPDNFGLSGMEFPNLRWDIIAGKRRVIEGYSGFPSGWIHFDRL